MLVFTGNLVILYCNTYIMAKKKEKKTPMQKMMKKTRKFLVNDKPMSQTIHWTLIFAIGLMYAIKVTEAGLVLNETIK